MNYEIRKNTTFNSNEIYFESVPEKAVRENLKKLGFRYHGLLHCWYGYKSEDQIRKAIEGNTTTTTKTNTETVNEYGVKVGDVFQMIWGYEQTNNNFFQVVAVTAKKARVVEVAPQFDRHAIGCMSENRTLTYKEGEMLPRLDRSMWIDNNEKGDLKTIKDFSKDHNAPRLLISSRGYYTASRCHSGETYYESYYA